MNRARWILLACGVMSVLSMGPRTPIARAGMSDATRSRLREASTNPRFEPWQREFMSRLAQDTPPGEPGSPGPIEGPLSTNGHWYQLSPSGSLPPLSYLHTAILDPTRNRMVVFGGAPGLTNDTWVLTFSPLSWNQMTTSGTRPLARWNHAAVYDPIRDRMIVFGGLDSLAILRNDVWALSFAGTPTWSQLSPSGTPPTPRRNPAVVYDPVRDRLMTFGGWDGFSELNDTWTLSLGGSPAWSLITPSGPPPTSRRSHTAIYDPVRDRLLIFGGNHGLTYLNDAWVLPLASPPAWTQLSPTGTLPSTRMQHTAIYDPVRDRMVIFAGTNGPPLNDTWMLSFYMVPDGWDWRRRFRFTLSREAGCGTRSAIAC